MPIWLPLPVSLEDDYYIDRSLNYLYEPTVIPEHLLPPVYFRKEKKKLRLDPSPNALNESPTQIRVRSRHRDGLTSATLSVASLEPPKSLFDRPSSIVAKLRQDMRLQKYRGLSRSTISNVPGLKPYFPPKIIADPDFVLEWLIHEDYALLQAIQHVQELPLNLSIMYPGHTPNWDLVSELVNQVSRIYRSPQQCKNRFESAILPREEGKLTTDSITKKQKKLKGVNPLVSHMKYTRNYKTAQLYLQDSNSTFTQMMNTRFDAIRGVSNRRAPTIKRLPITTTVKNPKHAQLLVECEIDYDHPLTPVEIATKRAQRLAKEKQTQMATAEQLVLRQSNVSAQQQPQVTKQVTQQHQQQQQQQSPVQQTAVISQKVQQQANQQAITVHKSVPIPTTNIVPQPTAVVVNITQNSPITTVAPITPVTIRSIVHRNLNVQEMIVANSAAQQQPAIVIPQTKITTVSTSTTNAISPSVQRIIPITQISTSPTGAGQRIMTASGKTLTSSQLQLYRQQQALQVRQQLKIFQSRGKTSVVVPANVVVSSPSQTQQQTQLAQPQTQQQQQQQQQPQLQQQTQQQQQQSQQQQPQPTQQRQVIKSVPGTLTTSTTRNLTEAEVAVILKRQQQQQIQQHQQQKITAATVIATTNASIAPTQFITAQSTSVPGQSTIGVPLPAIKTATISTANLKTTPNAQQFRQIAIQQQILQQQQRKPSTQKVTSIGQVMVNVTQSGGGQVISHVLTKTTQGNVATAAQLMGARVIPVVTSQSAGKQTIQVVNASALRAASTPNVTVDASGARHIQQTIPPNTIKISSGTPVATLTQQQNFLNQVSAALQNNPNIAVRQGNIKVQSASNVTTVAAVSSPSTNVTSSTPNTVNVSMPTTQTPTSGNDKA